jgi:hypothetical protein
MNLKYSKLTEGCSLLSHSRSVGFLLLIEVSVSLGGSLVGSSYFMGVNGLWLVAVSSVCSVANWENGTGLWSLG